MSKKTLLLGAGFAAGLVLFANGLLAQNTSTPPPAPAPKAAAPKVDLSKLPPPADTKGVTFDKDIAPMLKASCSDCHGGSKPKGGYNVATATSTIKDSKGRAMVIPGESSKSIIVLYVGGAYTNTKKVMPPLEARDKNPPLTKDQVALLRAWIDQGAK